MGRTTRWLRSLLGGKKESREAKEKDSGEERREKKRWSFKRDSYSDANTANPVPSAQDSAAWLRTIYSESEKEQNKHAIAVAAATAAAADAAVAAASAAAAVVRLTSHSRGGMAAFGAAQERLSAAVKIQTVFRAYLAKKALRALKSLVKLQALVRGYLVRKQAAATLHSMQALIRAQATVRAQKCRPLLSNAHRKSHESEHLAASAHSRRLSAIPDATSNSYDRSPKIVEIDTCRPKSRSSRSRTSPSLLDSGEDTLSSPLKCQIPTRIFVPDCSSFQDYYWCHPSDKCRYSYTAQSTPRYMNPMGMGMGIAPATPAKSVSAAADGGAFRRFFNCPNYMSNTQSFEAKVRSQSAPKQRPEPAVLTPGPRKRLPLSEVLLESRASLSGVGMQRSCNRVQEQFDFKRAVVDRIDRSLELGRETEQEFYLQRKW